MPQGAVIERTGLILLGELPASALIAAGLWPVFRSPAGAAWVSLRAFQLWWAAQQPSQAGELREALADPDGAAAARLLATWALAGGPGTR